VASCQTCSSQKRIKLRPGTATLPVAQTFPLAQVVEAHGFSAVPGGSSSACIVDRDGVAVRVSERERPAEGTIDRISQDRHAVLGELVMKDLGVVGP
jgi:hypothetical protein